MENLFNSVKSMFVNEDGGINWKTIIGLGAGAVGGYFLAPELGIMAEMPMVGAALGAGLGLMGSQVVSGMMGGSAEQPAPAAGAAPAVAAHAHGHGHAQEIPSGPQGGLPAGRPQSVVKR